MGSAFRGLFGAFGLGGAAKAPKASGAAAKAVKTEQTQAKKARSSFFKTEGGVSGAELNPDQVRKRDTLLGN